MMSVAWPRRRLRVSSRQAALKPRPLPEIRPKAYKGLNQRGRVPQNPRTWVPWPALLTAGFRLSANIINGRLLAGAGFRKQKNLRGGINAWARQVDPRLPVY